MLKKTKTAFLQTPHNIEAWLKASRLRLNPHQDPDDVVGLAATARQDERVRNSGGVVT